MNDEIVGESRLPSGFGLRARNNAMASNACPAAVLGAVHEHSTHPSPTASTSKLQHASNFCPAIGQLQRRFLHVAALFGRPATKSIYDDMLSQLTCADRGTRLTLQPRTTHRVSIPMLLLGPIFVIFLHTLTRIHISLYNIDFL